MEFRLHVHGDRACFKRPEFVEDLVSYDVITPMAARGIFESVHTAASMRWRIDEIRVLQPIRSTWMSLAELDMPEGDAVPLDRIFGGKRDRRMAHVLSDVAYVLTAHIEPVAGAGLGNGADEEAAIFRRRLARGNFVRPPFLGVRSFPAQIALVGADDPLPDGAFDGGGAVDLGWMLYDAERDDKEGLRLFRPTMVGGVIDLRRRETLMLAG